MKLDGANSNAISWQQMTLSSFQLFSSPRSQLFCALFSVYIVCAMVSNNNVQRPLWEQITDGIHSTESRNFGDVFDNVLFIVVNELSTDCEFPIEFDFLHAFLHLLYVDVYWHATSNLWFLCWSIEEKYVVMKLCKVDNLKEKYVSWGPIRLYSSGWEHQIDPVPATYFVVPMWPQQQRTFLIYLNSAFIEIGLNKF